LGKRRKWGDFASYSLPKNQSEKMGRARHVDDAIEPNRRAPIESVTAAFQDAP
jgi:hypothetical protein